MQMFYTRGRFCCVRNSFKVRARARGGEADENEPGRIGEKRRERRGKRCDGEVERVGKSGRAVSREQTCDRTGTPASQPIDLESDNGELYSGIVVIETLSAT